MNKIFKVIWSKARNCYVVVSELAKSHAKDHQPRHAAMVCTRAAVLAAFVLTAGFSGAALAAGTGNITNQDPNGIAGSNNLIYGAGNTGNGSDNVVYGKNNSAENKNAVVVGQNNKVNSNAENSIVIGDSATSDAANQIVIGQGTANGTAIGSIVIGGTDTIADTSQSIVIGNKTKANGGGQGMVVIGNEAMSDSNAAGYKNDKGTYVPAGIVLGEYSYSNTRAGRLGYLGDTAGQAKNKPSTAFTDEYWAAVWTATANPMAIGDADVDANGKGEAHNGHFLTRQITGVAAGTSLTDAVNVAQLQAAVAEIKKSGGGGADGNHTTVSVGGKSVSGDKGTVQGGNLTLTKSVNGAANYDLSLNDNLRLGEDTKAGTDGQTGTPGKEGSLGLAGKDGTIGKDGKQGYTTTVIKTEKGQNGKDGDVGKQGAPGLDGKDITRIVYENGQDGQNGTGGKHVVATLDDGLKFGGDSGTASTVKLNKQLNVTGGETDSSKLATGNNLGVVSNQDGDNGKLEIKLAKNLSGLDSVNAGGTVIDNKGLTIGGNTYVSNTGLNANNKVIANVANGSAANDAVNVSQLKGSRTTVTSSDQSLSVSDSKNGELNHAYDLKVNYDKVADNTSISYKANNGAVQTVTLKKGLDFTNGTNTTAEVDANGVVKFNAADMRVKSGSVTYTDSGKGTLTLTNGDKTTATIDGLKDTYTKSASYDAASKKATFVRNDATTYDLDLSALTAGTGKQTKVTVEGGTEAGATAYTGTNLKLKVTATADGQTTYDLKLGDNLSVGGKDGKDGKDGVDGHIGVNGKDGVSGVGIDGKDGISVKGKDGKDGVTIKGIDGVDGVNGAEGHIGLNGKDGMTDIWTKPGAPGLNGKDGESMTRVVYKDPQGQEHQGATLDDGLKFGDDFGGVAKVKLNHQLDVTGDINAKKKDGEAKATAADLSDGNIGVVATDTTYNEDGTVKENGKLTVKLAKDLKDLNSISISNGPSLTTNGIDAGDKKITNVADGTISKDSKEAVNGSQLNEVKNLAGKHTLVTADGKAPQDKNYVGGNIKINVADADGQKTFDVKLADTLTLGSGTNQVVLDGTRGQVSAGGAVVGLHAADTLTLLNNQNADSGRKAPAGTYVTGLTNKDWNVNDPTYVSGRAATEDQLKKVNDAISSQVAAKSDYRLIADPSGKYTVKDGTVSLTVKDAAHPDAAPETVTIANIASQSDLNAKTFGLTADDKNSVSKTLDNTITVTGDNKAIATSIDGQNLKISLKDNITLGGQDGKDGVDGHIGVNGADGKSGVAIDGKDGISVKGKDGKDGVTIKGIDGVDGVNGAEGHIGLNGRDGMTDIWTKPGAPGLNGKDGETMTRIVYKDPQGQEHQGATLDDGLKFGDDFGGVAKVKLNHQLNVTGDINAGKKDSDAKATAADLSDGNIGVVATDTTYNKDGTVKDNGKLTVKLAKDLKDLNSISISNGPSLTTSGIDAGDKKITNVADGTISKDSKEAVNGSQIYQLQTQAGAHATVSVGKAKATDDNKEVSGGNLQLTRSQNDESGYNYDLSLSNTLNLTDSGSLTIGNTLLNNAGLQIGGAQSITIRTDNVDFGGNVIHHAAAGTAATDVATVGQLTKIGADSKNVVIRNVGTDSAPDYRISVTNLFDPDNPAYGKITVKGNDLGTDCTDDHYGCPSTQYKETYDIEKGLSENELHVIGGFDLGSRIKSDETAAAAKRRAKTMGIMALAAAAPVNDFSNVDIKEYEDKYLSDQNLYVALDQESDGQTGGLRLMMAKNPTFNEGTKADEAAVMSQVPYLVAGKGVQFDTKTNAAGQTVYTISATTAGASTPASSTDGQKSTFTITANGSGGGTVNDGNTVNFKNGSNITATATPNGDNGIDVQFDLNKDITVSSVDTKTLTASAITADTLKVNDVTIDKDGINAGGQKITQVAPGSISEDSQDAVNGSQLWQRDQAINSLGGAVNKLDSRVNRVGAGAAALAALHPLDFDPDDKWDFAAGYGNYKDASAVAVGAYYRPNEDTMFSVGGSFGGGENMVNAGVSFKLGQGNHVSTSRVAMAKEIKAMRQHMAQQDALIAKLQRMNGLAVDPQKSGLFPDVAENHWAYQYVTKLAKAGVLEGYPDGEFKGDRMMTRYEFAAIVYRLVESGAGSTDPELSKLVKEFSPELQYIRIDTVSKDKNGKPVIERVRVIK